MVYAVSYKGNEQDAERYTLWHIADNAVLEGNGWNLGIIIFGLAVIIACFVVIEYWMDILYICLLGALLVVIYHKVQKVKDKKIRREFYEVIRHSKEFEDTILIIDSVNLSQCDRVNVFAQMVDTHRYGARTYEKAIITVEIESERITGFCKMAIENLSTMKWIFHNGHFSSSEEIHKYAEGINQKTKDLNAELLKTMFGDFCPQPDSYFRDLVFELTSEIEPHCSVSGNVLSCQVILVATYDKLFRQNVRYYSVYFDMLEKTVTKRYPRINFTFSKTSPHVTGM